MYKYFDNRVHPHLTSYYTKTPYLDTDIFNLQTSTAKHTRILSNSNTQAN